MIIYHARRYICPICKKTFYENNPFVVKHDKISKFTIYNVLEALKNPIQTFDQVGKDNNLSATTVQTIFDTYVQIPKGSLPEILCIDEFYNIKNGSGKYACVFLDFKTRQLTDVIPSRRTEFLRPYLQSFTEEVKACVKYVSIDMNENYGQVVHQFLKKALICVDSFHVIKNINDAVTKVRIKVMNRYDKLSDEYYLLKSFHFLINKYSGDLEYRDSKYNHRYKMFLNTHDILNKLLKIDSELTYIYNFKEKYILFNRYCSKDKAEVELRWLVENAVLSNINELKVIGSMLNNWFNEIINSFTIIDGKRISNGPLEAKNNRIKTIKKSANGYRNFLRFRNRILYCLNDMEIPLSPLENKIKGNGLKRGKYNKQK
jgi:transposase